MNLRCTQPSMEERLNQLSIHYHNELLHNVKLRDALDRIARLATEENDASVVAIKAREIAEVTLAAPRPPDPLAGFYDQGFHTGHPHPEYLHLPMRPTDEYLTV